MEKEECTPDIGAPLKKDMLRHVQSYINIDQIKDLDFGDKLEKSISDTIDRKSTIKKAHVLINQYMVAYQELKERQANGEKGLEDIMQSINDTAEYLGDQMIIAYSEKN